MDCLNIYVREGKSPWFLYSSFVSFYIYSGAPSSRFDIALEYDVNTDDAEDDHDSDDTEKMTNKRISSDASNDN